MPGDLVVLGRVVGAYGVRGWVRIQPFGDDPESWAVAKHWWLGDEAALSKGDASTAQCVALRKMRFHGDGLVAEFSGISDRDAAEAVKGRYVAISRGDLPKPEAGEYYWADLVGMSVLGSGGADLGAVDRLLETGANDVLVVKDGAGRERLLPFVSQVIAEVDEAARVIRVEWEAEW